VLKSKTAFERIQFVGYEVAESDEWYQKKMLRDKTARREYFSVERNKRQRGDLYITQILDEEMTPDDPRLR
jgi:CTP:phosphocholine cytidylyltransferase-like protein